MHLNWLFVPTFFIAAALFGWGVWHWPRLRTSCARKFTLAVGLILAVPGLLYAGYYTHLFDNAEWFYRWRALDSTELAAGGAGFLAGLVYARAGQARASLRRWLQPLVAAGLFAVLAVPYIKPALRPLDYASLQDRWVDGVCMQSTPSTCGPAGGATLLNLAGVAATERELARESYTYVGGTECWYLARAMARRGLLVRPVVLEPQTETKPFPAIAGTRLFEQGGAGHFIVILGEEEGSYVIADPMQGRRVIPADNLNNHYYFTGFYLVPAEQAAPEAN